MTTYAAKPDETSGTDYGRCSNCRQEIMIVPGGQGPHWVHRPDGHTICKREDIDRRRRHQRIKTERTSADVRFEQAWWYAIGRSDAGEQSTAQAGGAGVFAEYARREAESFDMHQTDYLPSIQDQFRAWQTSRGVVQS